MKEDTKYITVHIRMNDKEKNTIKKRANLTGKSFSEFMRMSAMGCEIKEKPDQKCYDSIMNEIERLEFEKNKKIIANKRVSNYLKVLDQVEAEVIKMILIDKKSKTYTVKTLDRSGRHIDRILERALKKIADIC